MNADFPEEIKFDSLPEVDENNVFVDGSDAYANNHKAFITFHYVPNQRAIAFKAFVTAFSDNFNSDWKSEPVYGRADPIYTYKNTKRSISLSFEVVASTDEEAYGNLENTQKLAQFMYPRYQNVDQAQTISNSPLVKIGFMNLITDTTKGTVTFADLKASRKPVLASKPKKAPQFSNGINGINGLLGAITSVNIDFPSLKDGNSLVGKGAIYPRLISVTVNFDPIHQLPLDGSVISEDTNFPYATNLHNDDGEKFQVGKTGLDKKDKYEEKALAGSQFIQNVIQEGRKRQETLAQTQQQVDIANARYNSMFGGLRQKRDERLIEKGAENARTERAFDNITTYYFQEFMLDEETNALSEPYWNK